MDNVTIQPRVVDAGRGASWWVGGWRLFASNPLTWIGLILVYMLVSFVMGIIPIIGGIAQALLTPVFLGGIMLGCRSIERDGSLRVTHLFEGFQGTHFVPLMIIGAVNLGLFIAMFAVAAVGVFGAINFAALSPDMDPEQVFDAFTAIPATGMFVALLMLVIVAVIMMLNWFAPSLVALRGVAAWDAMLLSFRACLRNWLAFLVYGLVALVIWGILAVLFVVVGFAFVASAFTSQDLGVASYFTMGIVLVLLFVGSGLVLGPIMFASVYASFVDVFDTGERAPGQAFR